jgi:membrane fusion protein, heavy metal efflux system
MSKIVLFVALVVGVACGVAGTRLFSSGLPSAASAPATEADEHDGHAGESASAHAGHGEEAEAGGHEADAHGHEGEEHAEGVVELSPEAVRDAGLEIAAAGPGQLEHVLKLPAEIVLNADRVAHIVPRATGIVRQVFKSIGDHVEPGELMALLESRELAEARAQDLAAEARMDLAETNLKRAEGLWKQKVTPEKEYLAARQKLVEAEIEHRATRSKLQALGVAHEQIASRPAEGDADFSRYEIRAPFAGTIVERHVVTGEVHDTNSSVFVVADLSTVWADITVYSQDADQVRQGAKVRVVSHSAGGEPVTAEGTLSYVSPILRESTRTGLARAVIANQEQRWRPGSFVTAEVTVSSANAPVVVPNTAIQLVENLPVTFVSKGDNAFERRALTTGRSNDRFTEVLAGLAAGERLVVKGGFLLKAESLKGSGGHEH